MTFPDDNPSMWGQLEHAGQTYPSDDRPDPVDLVAVVDVPHTPGCDRCGSVWQRGLCGCDYLCTRCNRNETRRPGECCWECADDLLAEEAHDRGRAGEWDD